MTIPTATYRIQFHEDFGFTCAKQLIDYLYDLGISDIYASPIFKACAGSMHGYDVLDHRQLDPALGGEADFDVRQRAGRREVAPLLRGWGQAQLSLGDLDPDAIQVELFAEPENGGETIRHAMARSEQLVAARGFSYGARVPASCPAADYTPRVVPFHPAAQVPLEETRILWQR